MVNSDFAGLLNLVDYPIDNSNAVVYSRLVERYRHELDTQQFCVLPNFLGKDSLVQSVQQVDALMSSGYRNTSVRNCYLQRDQNPALGAKHPSNIMFDASYTMLAADIFPTDFALKRLYYWPAMIRFISEVTRSEALYVSEDQYQPVNVLCSTAGDCSAWHFDSWNAFTMTLLLQAPEAGGEFQLVPNIRSRDNPNYQALSKVLQGDESRVLTVSRDPGSLVLFRGSSAVHRVTEVFGNRARLMGVFVYESVPGVRGDPQVNRTVYGPRAVETQ